MKTSALTYECYDFNICNNRMKGAMKAREPAAVEPMASSRGRKGLPSVHLRVSEVVSQVDALIGAFKAKNLRVKNVDVGKLQRTLHALEKESAEVTEPPGSGRRTTAPSDEELVKQVVEIAAQRSELDPFLDDMAAYLRGFSALNGWSKGGVVLRRCEISFRRSR